MTSPLVITGSGSGDKTFDWVHAFCVLVVSLGITAVWTAMDRRRSRYDRLDAWFRLFAAFRPGHDHDQLRHGQGRAVADAVAVAGPAARAVRKLLADGRALDIGRRVTLVQSWSGSRSSPAASCCSCRNRNARSPYLPVDTLQIFTLNMTYDIPVKLFAFHLIVLSLFLVAPQARQLLAALGLGPAVALREQPPLARGRRAVRILVAVQIAFGLYVIAVNAYGARAAWVQYGGGAPKSPLYGIWNVESMSIDGHIRSPLLTDFDRWRRVVFDRPARCRFNG